MNINKRERKFLRNAVSHGWEIYEHTWQKTCHWDDDVMFPVQIGAVCERLIDKGLLERCFGTIRATNLGESFKCKERHCSHGRLEKYDDDSDLISREVCQKCDGIGVLSNNGKPT